MSYSDHFSVVTYAGQQLLQLSSHGHEHVVLRWADRVRPDVRMRRKECLSLGSIFFFKQCNKNTWSCVYTLTLKPQFKSWAHFIWAEWARAGLVYARSEKVSVHPHCCWPAVSCPLVPVAAAAVAGAELTEGDQLEVQLILKLSGLFAQIWAEQQKNSQDKQFKMEADIPDLTEGKSYLNKSHPYKKYMS